jgi:hypothetical protein
MNAIQQRSQFRRNYRSYKLGDETLYVALLQDATYMLSEIGYTIDIVDGVYVLNHFDKVVASGVSGDYILEYVCRETFKYLEQDIDELLNELQKHSVNQSVVINNFAGTDKQALITLIEAHINRN